MARPARKDVEHLLPTPDRIVETATQLFLETGYAGTSMSALAKACGIQKASLYHHFESKEAVLFACFQTGFAETVERMRSAAERTDLSFQDRLPLVLDEVYAAIVSSGAGRMAPVVAETTGRIPEVAERFNDEFIEEMHEIFEVFARDGMEAGEFEPFDLGALDHALFGVPVNLTLCRSMFAKFPDLEERYAVETVKGQHLQILRKLLGLQG
ncbi:MAG: TetR/AcrR family transcriptional regulator [Devosiaceae bacterium]|nr:TetR/AcrR family transcriptional regulator [Devosiaceae bacterium MH13]